MAGDGGTGCRRPAEHEHVLPVYDRTFMSVTGTGPQAPRSCSTRPRHVIGPPVLDGVTDRSDRSGRIVANVLQTGKHQQPSKSREADLQFAHSISGCLLPDMPGWSRQGPLLDRSDREALTMLRRPQGAVVTSRTTVTI